MTDNDIEKQIVAVATPILDSFSYWSLIRINLLIIF